ncbi:hypothetical protein KR032_008191, partial [Drosophila birchii]
SSCLLFIVCALCYNLVTAQEEGGPAAVSPAKRIAALRRPVGKAAKTTTTTTPAPAQGDAAGEGEEYDEEAGEHGNLGEDGDEAAFAASSTTSTTTEAPKKVGPVIRPFRSNDDFLNSLKRRQANAKKHRAEKPPSPSKPAKKSDESNGSGEQEEPAAAPAPVPASSPAKGYKGNSALSRRKLSKPVKATPEPVEDAAAEESEQQQKEESKPKRPIGARLALRKRN